jgi:glycosyltransferase involved in cell wall biosynthesis
MRHNLKIVVPSYNNEKWIETNIESIQEQTYTNYKVLYINDASTDSTEKRYKELVGDDPKWTFQNNEVNRKRPYNVAPKNISFFFDDPEDILIFVDGDDWLPDPDTLKRLNEFYWTKNVWMTYGGMVCWRGGDRIEQAHPQNTHYPPDIHANNGYRRDLWRASHLRSFKWWLYQSVKDEDLRYSKTREYYHAEDLATSYPCLEMCPKERIGVLDFTSYVWNGGEDADGNTAERQAQENHWEMETECRQKTPYRELMDNKGIIVPRLAGGLGNMMFQIAAAYSFSKEVESKFAIDYKHIGTLHSPPTNYRASTFKNIPEIDTLSQDALVFKEGQYNYEPIDVQKLMNKELYIDGYYQSYKYFEKVADDIRKLFSPNETEKIAMNDHYGHLFSKETVSVHVRRGDYTSLQDYHVNLPPAYYSDAMKFFGNSKRFIVFSDDIEYCKRNFADLKDFDICYIEGEPDWMDLYLMAWCNHNIIANSTFSWWGAFLNENEGKIVIIPDKWFGSSQPSTVNTRDLFPKEWRTING